MERSSHQVDPLTASLEIASAFSTQVNTGVPVEIVDAENQTVEAVLAGEDGASTDEAMDISLEDEHKLDSTRLSAVPKSVAVPVPVAPKGSKTGKAEELTKFAGISRSISNNPNGGPSSSQGGILSSVASRLSTSSVTLDSSAMQSVVDTQVNSQLQGVSSTAIEQLNRSLGGTQALEISPDAISTLADNLTAHMAQSNSDGSVGRGQEMFNPGVNYSLEKFGIPTDGAGGIDPAVLHEPESPSSPESNFDSSDLLNTSLLHQDEITQRLASSGPVGIAAAAAIMSGRKRKRPHMFESNPSLRKRHCSKLTKRLKETIEELTTRVGLQAVVVTFRPAKGGVDSKSEASFKVFGAAPLTNVIKNQKEAIVAEMDAALHQQAPPVQPPTNTQEGGEPLFDLPPLTFDGIPTPVNKMTQAQLRTFIPNMLKFSTGRGKPGWGKEDVKPPWWPQEVPWANVRSDVREEEEKKKLPWTDCLRRVVISCYLHHGRVDLLPEFSIEHLQQVLTPEATEQLQVHLDTLQQQQGTSGMSISATGGEAMSSLSDVTAPSGGRSSEDLVGGDNQQVFTVDTGMGNCDTTGMPTLADASLAETAARLQQVADETGEVQYATQTVTVTDRDAKALGQPVGSTTTVLLTAYPGGHSGTVNESTSAPQDTIAPPFLSSQPSATTNIQVVYSAAHIDSIPDTVVSDISAPVTQTEPFSVTSSGPSSQTSGGEMTHDSAAGNEYLSNPTTGLVSGGNTNEEENPTDLATQLINEYAAATVRGPPALTSIAAQLTDTLTDKLSES